MLAILRLVVDNLLVRWREWRSRPDELILPDSWRLRQRRGTGGDETFW